MKVKPANENSYKFYIPADTKAILNKVILKVYEYSRRKNKEVKKAWRYQNISSFVVNPTLLFSKIFPLSTQKNEKDDKDKYLSLVISEIEKLREEFEIINKLLTRKEKVVKALESEGYKKKPLDAICSWRLIIGLGASHSQETSMTLHHIYGIPYIPGSAVKGVTRHWVVFSKHGNSEEKAEEDEEFVEIFGTQKKSGKVIFMDAYPVEDINLKIDIMNPHYTDYYSGSQPPADWQTPKPIKFLTVERTKFRFILLSKNEELLNTAEEWLKLALQEFGVGAKTSLGYGIFEKIEQKE